MSPAFILRDANVRERAIEHAELKSLLDYDQDTGVFTWKVNRRSVTAGQVAGYLRQTGYVVIRLFGKPWMAHRLAWLWMTGDPPPKYLDHINGLRSDNRIANLRAADPMLNAQNTRRANVRNESGFWGVSRSGKKFIARIRAEKKLYTFGPFLTRHEAHEAYLKAKRALHKGCTV